MIISDRVTSRKVEAKLNNHYKDESPKEGPVILEFAEETKPGGRMSDFNFSVDRRCDFVVFLIYIGMILRKTPDSGQSMKGLIILSPEDKPSRRFGQKWKGRKENYSRILLKIPSAA